MKKRIVSLFLAVLMVLTASVTVFASDEHDDLTVGASVKVSVAGKTAIPTRRWRSFPTRLRRSMTLCAHSI